MKFSTKLSLLVLSVVVAIGFIATYYIYNSNIKILDMLIHRGLETLAYNSMDKIDKAVYYKHAQLEFLAADPVIVSKSSSPEQITERLRVFKKINGSYESISFFTIDRRRVADTAGIAIGTVHEPNEYWPGIYKGDKYVTSISMSSSLNKNVVHFAAPVNDANGKPYGVVVARMPLEGIIEMLGEVKNLNDGMADIEVRLADANGLLLYSTQGGERALKDVSPEWVHVSAMIKGGANVGTVRHPDESRPGSEEVAAFASSRAFKSLRDKGWTIIIDVTTEKVFEQAVILRRGLIIVLSVIGVLAVVVVYFMSKRIGGPIKELGDAAAEVGRGNLDVRVSVRSRDEIGVLGNVFNQMVENLRDNRVKLHEYTGEIDEKRARLVEAQRIARLGNWVYDMLQRTIHVSDGAYGIFGVTEKEFDGTFEGFMKVVHPNDRRLVKKSFEATFNGGKPYDIDYRIVRTNDGAERMIHARGEVLRGSAGVALKMVGTVQDITERKKTEEQLKIFRKFIEASGQCFVIAGLDAAIIYANPILCTLLDVGRVEDIYGTNLVSYYPKELQDRIRDEILPGVLAGGQWVGELALISRNNVATATLENYFLICDESGNPVYLADVITNINERKMLEDELKLIATTDSLTGAYNRVKFEEIMKNEISSARRYSRALSLMIFDIDHFKSINDTYGHGVGDYVLQALVVIVKKGIRDIDYLVRWGGEEFIVILPDTDIEGGRILAERILKSVEDHVFDRAGRVTISMGIVHLKESDTEDTIIKRADAALYRAKRGGRNRVEVDI